MRLMVLSINYAPEMIGIAVYSAGMAEGLARYGHQVQVITAQPYYPGWKVFPGWRRFGYTARRAGPGVNVLHCPLYVPLKPSGLQRILHHLSFALTAMIPALWAGLRQRPDVVIVVAPSLISALLVRSIAWLGQSRTWLHIQDFEVEAAFATGLLSETGPVGRLARRFEARILKRFDRVSTISTAMEDRLAKKGLAKEKIVSFRNWADLTSVPGNPPDCEFKSDLGITTRYVALYAGNLASKQGLEVLPEMARYLEHRQDLTILICGEGSSRAELEIASAGLKNIAFRPLQPKNRLGALLSIADVHLLPQIAEAVDLVLPSKLTNMLASARPIIATTPENTALADELTEAGRVTPPGDARALATALEALLDAPETRAQMGNAARARAMSHWAEAAVLEQFEQDLSALISEEKGLVELSTASHKGASLK